MVDSTKFMDKSFDNLQWYSNSFNISPFIPVVVGMVVTHHALLTSLWVNVSHFPLKIFLSLLESDTTAASGQMALLQYMTQQSITIQEGQAKMVPALRASTRDMDSTIESDHSYTVPQSRRPKPEQSAIALSVQDKKEAHLSQHSEPPPPPLPLALPAEEPHTPKGRDARMSGSMAGLMAQFQQCHDGQSREATPHGRPEKVPPMVPMAFSTAGKAATTRETPTKETPQKSEQTLSKKGLTPDTTPEPPVKKQQTGSLSSDQGDDSEHGDTSENKKKKKKKERKSAATTASDSEADETEEQQEKRQWAKKWKHELQALIQYWESHNIFLHNLPPRDGSSHIGYLESRITEADSGFFIKSIKVWQHELETQSRCRAKHRCCMA